MTIQKPTIIMPNDALVELGDTKQIDFFPQMKTTHWENECNFSIRLVDDMPTDGVVSVSNDGVLSWSRSGREARFYKTSEAECDGFEIEVVLNEKPISNVLQYSVQSKGFDLLYQPALTSDEIRAGAARPDKIVGSYVAYHSQKRGNREGGFAYSSGKAFHIYRPMVSDSAGHSEWCELSIVDSVLSIAIPQEFLDTAVYPLVVDPTFGYTTTPGSTQSLGQCAALIGSAYQYAASSGDTITGYSAYCGGGGSSNPQIEAYDFNGTIPVNRLGGPQTITAPGSIGWASVSGLSESLVASTNYVVGIASGFCVVGYDSGSTNDQSYGLGTTLPATYSQSFNNGQLFGIYATYSAGSAASSVPSKMSTYRRRGR